MERKSLHRSELLVVRQSLDSDHRSIDLRKFTVAARVMFSEEKKAEKLGRKMQTYLP